MAEGLDRTTFEREGFAMRPSLLSPGEVDQLIELLEANTSMDAGRGGVRDIMTAVPALTEVAAHKNVRAVVDSVLGQDAFVVRCTLFDKTDASNWKVPWHQDLTIAVKERIDTDGYGPWSIKQGVLHVQPPTDVLSRMVTVRIHLDPCPASNGALRVMPGTHHLGRMNQNDVAEYVDEDSAVTCAAQAGEALAMRPLLLHASSPSAMPTHRRVLHFDFAACDLSDGLRWNLR